VEHLAIISAEGVQFSGTPVGAFQPIDEDVRCRPICQGMSQPQSKARVYNLRYWIASPGKHYWFGQWKWCADSRCRSGCHGAEATPIRAAEQYPARNRSRSSDRIPRSVAQYKWWILSLAAVLLAVGAAFLMKQKPACRGHCWCPACRLPTFHRRRNPLRAINLRLLRAPDQC